VVRFLAWSTSFPEICALLGYYVAACGNCLPTFRDNISVPSSKVKIPRSPLKMRPIHCPETSVNNYHTTQRHIPEERRFYQHHGGSLKWKEFPLRQIEFRRALWPTQPPIYVRGGGTLSPWVNGPGWEADSWPLTTTGPRLKISKTICPILLYDMYRGKITFTLFLDHFQICILETGSTFIISYTDPHTVGTYKEFSTRAHILWNS
jgi:hypothetical protein